MPKADFCASAKEGINQAGCGYTAQGFKFDYVGVIFGPDLVYRPMDGGWSAGAEFTASVKSTYCALRIRGL